MIMKRVLIIQEHLPHYRIPFFECLRTQLSASGVQLDVICNAQHSSQFVGGRMAWATRVAMPRLLGLVWHRRTLARALASDLVIAPQEIKYLVPLLVLAISRVNSTRFAFWGHGKNFQAASENSIKEQLKRFLSRRVDWWFAYNNLSARVVHETGFPTERTTSVVNSIDTTALSARRADLTADEISAARIQLGISTDNVAIYTGGLYPLKRLPFLIQSVELIRHQIPDFEFIIIGDGPERPWLENIVLNKPWIHFLGAKSDHDKVPYWAISKVLLMPGGVGLIILDSFALGVPMMTTDTHLHGPEIEYLNSGDNGVLVECGKSPQAYANAVVRILRTPTALQHLQAGAMASANHYTIQQMAANFTSGILAALEHPEI